MSRTSATRAPESIGQFLHDVFMTPAGRSMIVIGNGVGFLFALAVLTISVVSFPLLLDRDAGAAGALLTSVRAVLANPVPMALWGLIVAALLALGSLPLFLGLPLVLPVLGHATWHLYRKVVEPDPNPRPEYQSAAQGHAPRRRFPGGAVPVGAGRHAVGPATTTGPASRRANFFLDCRQCYGQSLTPL